MKKPSSFPSFSVHWNGSWLEKVVLEWWECLSWMDWVSWRVCWLDTIVSELVVVNELMVPVELWIVPNSNPLSFFLGHARIIIHLNWIISFLFNPLILVVGVSVGLHPSHWLVWLMDWFEFTDLPQLQSVKLGMYAFWCVHSVVFESDWMDGLMIQICQCYNPFDLVHVHLMVIIVMIERRLVMNPSITRTHWLCEVRLNKLMNE